MVRRMVVWVASVLTAIAVVAPTASAIPDDPDPATAGAELNGKIVTILTTTTTFTVNVSGFCGTSSVTISSDPAISGLPTTVTTSTAGTASVTLPLPTALVNYVITATANPAAGAPAICTGSSNGTLALEVAQGGPTTTAAASATTTAGATTTTQVASAAPGGQLPVGGSDTSTPLQIASVAVMAGGGLVAISALRRRRIRTAPTP